MSEYTLNIDDKEYPIKPIDNKIYSLGAKNMQLLVIYQKKDRRVLISFKWDTFITGANVLATPGTGYIFSLDKDIFIRNEQGEVFLSQETIDKFERN